MNFTIYKHTQQREFHVKKLKFHIECKLIKTHFMKPKEKFTTHNNNIQQIITLCTNYYKQIIELMMLSLGSLV